MTTEESELLQAFDEWTVKIRATAAVIGRRNDPRLRLSPDAAHQLRNIAEAISAAELVAYQCAAKTSELRDPLMRLSEGLSKLHHAMDDVVLPAAIAD